MNPLFTRVPALLLALFLLSSCQSENSTGQEDVNESPLQLITGEAMGSYYRITYLGEPIPKLQTSVDSLLDSFNLELSPWVAESRINAFNISQEGVSLADTDHFIPNLELAGRVVERTRGAYDPTVAPLVKYWGFGTGKRRTTNEVDSVEVNRIKERVGFELLELEADFLRKQRPGVELDLNASAKGYGVDLISQLLRERGRPNHLIDIGGEFRSGGSKNGKPWRVAIRLPEEDAAEISAAGTLPLTNDRGIATSGNYLNYYKVDGETYSHTINPLTGYVERNRLLSASVIAPDCATADAYATACMVLGPEGALKLVEADPDLEGYFLVRGEDGDLEVMATKALKNQ